MFSVLAGSNGECFATIDHSHFRHLPAILETKDGGVFQSIGFGKMRRNHQLTGNLTKTAGKHTIIARPCTFVSFSEWQVAMRDAQLLHLFADEALEKYSELNGQNLILGSYQLAGVFELYIWIEDPRGVFFVRTINEKYAKLWKWVLKIQSIKEPRGWWHSDQISSLTLAWSNKKEMVTTYRNATIILPVSPFMSHNLRSNLVWSLATIRSLAVFYMNFG